MSTASDARRASQRVGNRRLGRSNDSQSTAFGVENRSSALKNKAPAPGALCSSTGSVLSFVIPFGAEGGAGLAVAFLFGWRSEKSVGMNLFGSGRWSDPTSASGERSSPVTVSSTSHSIATPIATAAPTAVSPMPVLIGSAGFGASAVVVALPWRPSSNERPHKASWAGVTFSVWNVDPNQVSVSTSERAPRSWCSERPQSSP